MSPEKWGLTWMKIVLEAEFAKVEGAEISTVS